MRDSQRAAARRDPGRFFIISPGFGILLLMCLCTGPVSDYNREREKINRIRN